MAAVIRKNRSAAAILADALVTLKAAAVRGGEIAQQAARFLADSLTIAAEVAEDRKLADKAVLETALVVDAAHRQAILTIAAAFDELWNALERPRYEARLALWFPDHATTCQAGGRDRMPVRMRVVAELIRKKPHPLLEPQRTEAVAGKIEAAADRLEEALDASDGPAAKAELYGKVYTGLAKGTQMQLIALKRALLSLGYRPTQIHEIVPDRRVVPQPAAADPSASAEPEAAADPVGAGPAAAEPADDPSTDPDSG